LELALTAAWLQQEVQERTPPLWDAPGSFPDGREMTKSCTMFESCRAWLAAALLAATFVSSALLAKQTCGRWLVGPQMGTQQMPSND